MTYPNWLRRSALLATVSVIALASSFASAKDLEVGKGEVIKLRTPADSVFVTDPDVADVALKNPRVVFVYAKKPGRSQIVATSAEGNTVLDERLYVTHNLVDLRSSVLAIAPEAVNVTFSTVAGAIVIDGSVPTGAVAADVQRLAKQFAGKDGSVIDHLGVTAPTQVRLNVKVAEISRSVSKRLGINWAIVGNNIAFATFPPAGAAIAGSSLLSGNGGVSFGGLSGLGAGGAVLGGSGSINGVSVTGMLDALENEGLASILAEPNLTAMSGQTANFLAGGEFPILVPQGDYQTTVEFKKFGVSLAFTPTVTGKGRINLHVKPEVSQLSDEGAVSVPVGVGGTLLGANTISIPALKVRRAESTVELGSGQSFAIAGLLSNDSLHGSDKIPGLGDIPVIGRLFTSDAFKRKQTELVIIVTPYLVEAQDTMPAAPTDGFTPPNDWERMYQNGTWEHKNPGPSETVTPKNDE